MSFILRPATECRSQHEAEAEGGHAAGPREGEAELSAGDARPRSVIPRPEGYRGTLRSSVPPPKPQSGPPRSTRGTAGGEERWEGEDANRVEVRLGADGGEEGGVSESSVSLDEHAYTPTPSSARVGGPALMPMRIIAVKGEMSGPPPPREAGPDSLAGGSSSRLVPDVQLRSPGSVMSEPPPLPGGLRSSPQHDVPTARAVPPVQSLSRPDSQLPSSPRVEPPLPSSPRAEPPPPPVSRRQSGEPPALVIPAPSATSTPFPVAVSPFDSPPSQPRASGEPPPLPGNISRPPARSSKNPRSNSGEPPPLPKSRPSLDELAGTESYPQRSSSEAADDIELESIPPLPVELREAAEASYEENRRSAPPRRKDDLRAGEGYEGERFSGPPRNSIPGGGDPQDDVDSEGVLRQRQRPAPPAPPLRSVPRDAGRDSSREPPELEITVEPPLGPEETSRPPQRKRRLPPTPPPRTSLTGGYEEESSKRKHWWEEVFNDDFLRADFELTESQLKSEVDFIQESLKVERGGLVLDLACGNGRHATELARRGYTAVGYDLSLAQLARASERAQRSQTKVSFLHGDMREMAFEPTFDGVYCWNASFGYFEEEKNQAVLRNVFRALKPGGSLLLDIPNRDFVVANQPNQNWFEGDGCVCMDDMQVDFITSRLLVKRTIMLDDGRNRECIYSIRLYGLHELGRMLHEAGFRVTEVSGHISMRGVFMGGTSPRLMLLVIKP